jgi:hypothetical protein
MALPIAAFALDRDNGALQAFASIVEAVAHCKGVDVADGFWRFFAEDGSPLDAQWERPVEPESDDHAFGPYTLVRAMSGLWLQERLAEVVTVTGCGLGTVEELAETLRINRGKRVMRDAARGRG